ncbi:hypothetical protein V1478_003622, partial [Vespula squamosa]
TNTRKIILFIVLGQDAPRAKDQQRLCTNARRIILFVVLGQDAHRASINEDFKASASPKRISTNFDVDLPHFQPTTYRPPSIST